MPAINTGTTVDVVPTGNADLENFAIAFATNWNNVFLPASNPTPTGGIITNAKDAYVAAITISSDPLTRTKATIAATRLAKADLLKVLRQAARYAKMRYLAGTATAVQLESLGLKVPDTAKTTQLVPNHSPILGVVSVEQDQVRLRLTQTDENGVAVSTRAFNRNYIGAEIEFTPASSTPVPMSMGFKRRVNIVEPTVAMANGTIVSARSRYVTRRGDKGPWSASVQFVVMRMLLAALSILFCQCSFAQCNGDACSKDALQVTLDRMATQTKGHMPSRRDNEVTGWTDIKGLMPATCPIPAGMKITDDVSIIRNGETYRTVHFEPAAESKAVANQIAINRSVTVNRPGLLRRLLRR